MIRRQTLTVSAASSTSDWHRSGVRVSAMRSDFSRSKVRHSRSSNLAVLC